MVLIAIILGLVLINGLVDGVLQNPFANLFISIYQNVFQLDYESARSAYYSLFQKNKTIWLAIGFFILLIVIFYFALSRFTRYFNEISKGIDKLAEEEEKEIVLSPELEFLERKLNIVKNRLERRAFQAQEAEQRKNDLVVYLAHDIKTPLTSVIGYLSLLDEAPDMPDAQKEKYVKITLDKAYRLEQLINEFFEITRFNLQTIVLEKEKINLPYMLMQMADEFYPLFAEKGQEAVVHTEEDLIVEADANKLARVFNNILKNAITYSYENSSIEISAHKEGDNAKITFSNYGKTIPSQKLNTIFDKFYRLDTSRSTHTGGAGLGLAIAKEIIQAHGGNVMVESEDDRTVFTVVVPLIS